MRAPFPALLLLVIGLTLSPGPGRAQTAADRNRERHEDFVRSQERDMARDRERYEQERAEIQRRADEDERHLQGLKRRLQQCGSCAERAALQQEIAGIEAARVEGKRIYCASFDQMRALNPATVDLVAALVHRKADCLGVETAKPGSANAAGELSQRQQLALQARSGKPEDLHRLAAWHLTVNELDRACPLLQTGAERGHGPSSADHALRCLIQRPRASSADQQRGQQLLAQCANQGMAECISAQAMLTRRQEAGARRDAVVAERRAQLEARKSDRASAHARQCERLARNADTLAARAESGSESQRRLAQRRWQQASDRHQADCGSAG